MMALSGAGSLVPDYPKSSGLRANFFARETRLSLTIRLVPCRSR